MIFIFSAILLFYYVFIIVLFIGWHRVQLIKPKVSFQEEFVSIVISVRNEEQNIEQLLISFEKLNYPINKFELLIIDDHSEDQTVKLIKNYQIKAPFQLRLFNLRKGLEGKKKAIELGVENANGEVILVTDGDCTVPSDWINQHVNQYSRLTTHFVTGPVSFLKSKKLWIKMQIIEFASLIGTGAACIGLGKPTMANAANMSFRRDTFKRLKAYEGVSETPSGDDELLMHKIFKEYGSEGVTFLKSRKALVWTHAAKNLKQFLNQRRRWASKWKHYQLNYVKLVAALVFCFQLSFLILLGRLFLSFDLKLLVLLLSKMIFEGFFLNRVLKFLGQKLEVGSYLILQIIYPIYVIFVGSTGALGPFNWKGRNYS